MTKDEAILELIQVVQQIKPKSAGEHEYLSILMHEAETQATIHGIINDK
jgi:hypothetical protein